VNDGVLRKYDIEACGFEGEGARHEVPEQFRSFFAEHRHRVGRALVRGVSCVCSGSGVSRGGESDFSVRSLGLSGCCVARFFGALR
jgi:hypothetical protein